MAAALAESYANRRVLITGGNGFLGLNLVAALRGSGAELRILSRSAPPAAGEAGAILAGVRHFQGDLRDRAAVEAASQDVNVIFNLAGHSGSTSSNEEPFEDLDINLRGHLTLLEACRRVEPAPTVVFASSRLVYRPTDQLPVSENALTGPLSLYGVHKLTAEHYHLLYGARHGLKTVVLRITNPYGHFHRSGERRYGIINWLIQRAVAGDTLPIYGDGHQLRDYVHAADVASAFMLAGAHPKAAGQTFNVGSGSGLTMRDAADAIVDAAGQGRVEYVAWPREAASVETGDFVGDVSRIRDALGWIPKRAPRAGLQQVVREYRQMNRQPAATPMGEGGRP
jgi:nucleoside-diphosphate-sugar epimerase